VADHFTIEISDEEIAEALTAPRPEYLLTPLQAAGILAVDRQTIYRYVKQGRLRAERPSGAGNGRVIRIPAGDVRRMLVERLRTAESMREQLLGDDAHD